MRCARDVSVMVVEDSPQHLWAKVHLVLCANLLWPETVNLSRSLHLVPVLERLLKASAVHLSGLGQVTGTYVFMARLGA